MHYRRWQLNGDPGPAEPMLQPTDGECAVAECDAPIKARGWCEFHYLRWRRDGDPGHAHRRKLYGERVRDGRKLCTTCREWVPVSEFGADKRSKDGLRAYCRGCRSAEWRRRTYGLTPSQYDEMREAQGDRCAMCGDVLEGAPPVDHCHDSGLVRELLCHRCNRALGFLLDDPIRADAAACYLRKWAHLKEARRAG